MPLKTDACDAFLESPLHLFFEFPVCVCVLQRAGCQAAAAVLLKRRLLLFGKVLRYPVEHPMHQTSFIPGTLLSATGRYIRRVGRPRREWISEVRNKTFEFCDRHRELTGLAQNLFFGASVGVPSHFCPRAAQCMTD